MHIHFKQISWRNFLSTGNNKTTVSLDKYTTRLIVGENGAGKSTLLDAITFAIYNKPFRKVNKPQLINSINKKDCVVEVEFVIGTTEYLVRRGMKPNIFEIYKNGELINQDAASRDYQEMLEKYILKLNYKAFCQVVIVGSASFVPFMQLTTANRREVIEDILDIKIFSTMNTLLKEEVSQNKSELRDVEYGNQLITEKIRMFKETQTKLEKNADTLIADYQQKIADTKSQVELIEQEVDVLMDETEELNKGTEDKEGLDKKLREMDKIEYSIKDKIEKLGKDIEFYESNDECPTCRQAIDEHFRTQTISDSQKAHDRYSDGIKELNQQYNKISTRLDNINNVLRKIEDKQRKIADRNSDIRSNNKYITQLIGEIESLNKDRKNIQDNNKLIEHEKEFVKLKEQYETLKSEADVLHVAGQLLRDNGIKSQIIKQYIPVMNKLINGYLQKMDFFAKFELDENFNETILSRHRDNYTYMSFSEGEKFRIDLSLLFTWRRVAKLKNSVSTNLLIMDEVFDSSLDADGTEEFIKLIHELDEKSNVFVISHKGDQLFDKFDNVLKFEKVKNFSRVAGSDIN